MKVLVISVRFLFETKTHIPSQILDNDDQVDQSGILKKPLVQTR